MSWRDKEMTRDPRKVKKIYPIARSGVFPTLVALAVVFVVCVVLTIQQWPQTVTGAAAGSTPPLQAPGGAALAPLQLSASYSVLYEQALHISLLSTTNGVSRTLETPGYIYNRAVTPILTPTHELLYSGAGIWATSLTPGHARRLAALAAGQVITSLALSSDGRTIGWSTAPEAGNGTIAIYTSSLDRPDSVVRVYEQPATHCPCFRIFSFLPSDSLLLTNDFGDHRLVQYGLWLFNPAAGVTAQLRPLLASDVQQGPLLLQNNKVLYTSYEGFVPMPDGGVPADITSLHYANSLLVASINQARDGLEGSRVILPAQRSVSGSAEYRWVATPQLSPEGRTLAYAEFSSADRLPFARHYALYAASMEQQAEPQLLATASAQYIELGPWLTTHVLTFYADNALYALDTQHAALTTLAQTGEYARVISIVG
ncbi:MAG: hypothetical protein NVSMB44_38180 [Ktedonobacteraceae bacterium]